ncbi:MAG TPA: MCE family protein [Pseudonocardia sp.]|jgi:phospholipid/cholesterol/gamma-HCH transport system substrate-binding protein|nr:MCE family protein [Pseudonocardia sp.]
MSRVRKRLQGLAFVAVLLLLVTLAVASYSGAFEDGVPVTLRVERTGSQLNPGGDVKVRGLIVGSIESIGTEAASRGASVQLQLDPELVDRIPAGVSARLLPKTLFGEKYVELVLPEGVDPVGGVARPIAAGDVIPLDRSRPARELERALDGLLPLLQAVQPQDLATTLGALSAALEGRGENLGETLVRLQELTGGIRPALPDLQEDITQLADFAGNLDEAAPDLLDALEDFSVTSRTLVEQRADLQALFTGLTGASDDLRAFLDRNGEDLIALADASRPTLESLARYSPQFPCLFSQLAGAVPEANRAFGAENGRPGIHITLEIVNSDGKYVPDEDEPEYGDDRGPRCYPIVIPGPQYPPDGPFRDGSRHPVAPEGTPRGEPEDFGVQTFGTYDGSSSYDDPDVYDPSGGSAEAASPGAGSLPASMPGPASGASASYTGMGVANSPGEQRMVRELVAAQDGTSPESVPAWGSMMLGPLYRGSEVTLT